MTNIRCKCGNYYRRRETISDIAVAGCLPLNLPPITVDTCKCGRFIPVTRYGMQFKQQIRAILKLEEVLCEMKDCPIEFQQVLDENFWELF